MDAPRILITRAAEDAEGLAHLLATRGYTTVRVPLLLRRWCVDEVVLAAATHPQVDLVVVTSTVTADVLAAAAPNAWRDARFAAVGPSTAARLTQHGLAAHVVPARATGGHLLRELGDVTGMRILYPRSAIAPPKLADQLRDAGATVYEVVAYDNEPPPGHTERLRDALPVDATPLLSGSAARRLAAALPPDSTDALGAVVAIGPSTAMVCRAVGLPVHAVAKVHTVGGLLEALDTVVPVV